MTEKELETIKDNLNAYKANFDYISIEKENYGKGYYIFTTKEKNSEIIPNIVTTLII